MDAPWGAIPAFGASVRPTLTGCRLKLAREPIRVGCASATAASGILSSHCHPEAQ